MEADKEEIRARNDILEVIGAVVQLQRRGRNWVGLCPFHQEKTPSFNVDPVTQTFKCFGCGASGDVFTFIERQQNMTFAEAAEYLARRVGLTFGRQGTTPQQRTQREEMYELHSVALTYFQQCLKVSPDAQQYLRRRMLQPTTIEQFQIGYATDSWDGLVTYLERRKIDLKLAAAAGLVAARRSGDGYVDVFRNRIMFPIHDEQMRVVGFGGRAMGDEEPKYRNSPESPIFQKNRLLYGLPFARRKVADERCVLIVEGYVDVITAHQGGFTNAVASLGTAFTAEHARRLARLAPNAVVVYDADEAGVKAALRAAAELEEHGILVRVARLPEGEDPDSLIRSGRSEALALAIKEAISRVEMELDLVMQAADTTTDHGRQQLVRQIIEILATVPTRTERDYYVERVWRVHPLSVQGPSVAKEQLHRDAEEARRRLKRLRAASAPAAEGTDASSESAPARTGRTEARAHRAPVGVVRLNAAEMVVLRAMVDPELRSIVLVSAEPDDLLHETDRQLLAHLLAEPPGDADEATLLHRIRQTDTEGFADRLAERLQESTLILANEPINTKVVMDAVRILRQRRTEAIMAELRERLKSKYELTEEDRALLQELQRLQQATGEATVHS